MTYDKDLQQYRMDSSGNMKEVRGCPTKADKRKGIGHWVKADQAIKLLITFREEVKHLESYIGIMGGKLEEMTKKLALAESKLFKAKQEIKKLKEELKSYKD